MRTNNKTRTTRNVLGLQGSKFNHWTVVSLDSRDSNYVRHWQCVCVCGNKRIVAESALKRGESKSCGCRKKEGRAEDLTGNTYNNWTVLYRSERNSYVYWFCRCACGKIKEVRASHLKGGTSANCGCSKKPEELIGRRFDRLLALEKKEENGREYWKCLCDCGNISYPRRDGLISGNQRSCGCLHRENLARSSYKHGLSGTPEHHAWINRRREEKKIRFDTSWTFEMELSLRDFFNSCVLCGRENLLAVDHLLPISLGHGLFTDNAVVLCNSCNSSKGSKYITDLPPEIRRKLIDASCEFQDYYEGEIF